MTVSASDISSEATRWTYLTKVRGTPVRRPLCKTIRYSVDTKGAPARWAPKIAGVLKSVHAANGLTFARVPYVKKHPYSNASLIFQMRSPSTYKYFKHNRSSESIGRGGQTYTYAIVSGHIQFLSMNGFAIYNKKYGVSAAHIRSVMLHEVGHALGLGHTRSKHQVMYPVDLNHQHYGLGDRSGLRHVVSHC